MHYVQWIPIYTQSFRFVTITVIEVRFFKKKKKKKKQQKNMDKMRKWHFYISHTSYIRKHPIFI